MVQKHNVSLSINYYISFACWIVQHSQYGILKEIIIQFYKKLLPLVYLDRNYMLISNVLNELFSLIWLFWRFLKCEKTSKNQKKLKRHKNQKTSMEIQKYSKFESQIRNPRYSIGDTGCFF